MRGQGSGYGTPGETEIGETQIHGLEIGLLARVALDVPEAQSLIGDLPWRTLGIDFVGPEGNEVEEDCVELRVVGAADDEEMHVWGIEAYMLEIAAWPGDELVLPGVDGKQEGVHLGVFLPKRTLLVHHLVKEGKAVVLMHLLQGFEDLPGNGF